MSRRKRGFTLIELMVVIGIIAVLIGILIPVISKVRERAWGADTKNFVNQLSASIEAYHTEFRAYPGPILNNDIRSGGTIGPAIGSTGVPLPFNGTLTATAGYDAQAVGVMGPKITMSENLVLGLLGGLRINANTNLVYDPAIVGLGPMSLNGANPKRFEPFFASDTHLSWRTDNNLKTGRYGDDAVVQGIDDTVIPEFVDSFPDPMPVLYFRAKPGVPIIPTNAPAYGNDNNSVITNVVNPAGRVGAYDLTQNIAYTASYNNGTIENQPVSPNAIPTGPQSVGTGKSQPKKYYVNNSQAYPAFAFHGLRSVNVNATLSPGAAGKQYDYPYDAFAYFQNPNATTSARNKDSYILIAAGPDRIYGTSDDIVSFGTVGE